MTIDDKIRDEKLQYDINRKAALSSGRINKYEFLTGKEILSSKKKNRTSKVYLFPSPQSI